MKKIGLYIMAMCLLCACVEDESTGIFNDLRGVEISNLEEQYEVLINKELRISPTVDYVNSEAADFDYRWFVYTPTSRYEADTLAHTRELNYVVDPSVLTPNEAYTLVFEVKDKASGIFYKQSMQLNVLTLYSNGLLLLCENNAEKTLSFLRMGEDYTLYENCYTLNNGEALPNGVTHLSLINPSPYHPHLHELLIGGAHENGGLLLNPSTLVASRTVSVSLNYQPEVFNTQAYEISSNRLVDYLIVNGQVCKRAVNMGNALWEAPMVAVDGVNEYVVTPYFFDILGENVFYDELNGRLLRHERWNMGGLREYAPMLPNSLFDINDLGDNKLIAVSNHSDRMNSWMVLQNTVDGRYMYYKFLPGGNWQLKWVDSVDLIELNNTNCPDIESATSFAVEGASSDNLFYCANNKIYVVFLNNLQAVGASAIELMDGAAQGLSDIHTIQIKMMSLVDPATGETVQGQFLMAFGQSSGAGDQKGSLVISRLSNIGGMQLMPFYSELGFCDQLIDVILK